MLVIYNAKITETDKKLSNNDHAKYITTLEFNNWAATVLTARLEQVNLITKTDFDNKLKTHK